MHGKIQGFAYDEKKVDVYLDVGQVSEFLIQEVAKNASVGIFFFY